MTNIVFKGFNINKVLYEIINERNLEYVKQYYRKHFGVKE